MNKNELHTLFALKQPLKKGTYASLGSLLNAACTLAIDVPNLF